MDTRSVCSAYSSTLNAARNARSEWIAYPPPPTGGQHAPRHVGWRQAPGGLLGGCEQLVASAHLPRGSWCPHENGAMPLRLLRVHLKSVCCRSVQANTYRDTGRVVPSPTPWAGSFHGPARVCPRWRQGVPVRTHAEAFLNGDLPGASLEPSPGASHSGLCVWKYAPGTRRVAGHSRLGLGATSLPLWT